MGIRSTVVFCVTSFLLGTLFTHWIADSLTLWKSPITDEHLWTAATYYSSLSRAAPFVFYLLTGIVTLGAVAILWSFGDGEAVNLMFDGGSVFLFGTTIALYCYSVIPSMCLRRIIPARWLILLQSSPQNSPPSLPTSSRTLFPDFLRTATLDLASNNLMCSVALTGVIILQAGRFWTERSDDSQFAAEFARQTALLRGPQSRARTPEPQKL
ncbi:Shr3 amino acid permease chaperone [Mycena amicta]|nr:Shr3 amino acid permease chaperone [Mycena amicta]